MKFEDIQNRLLDKMREQVQNGDITERGFARSVSISQAHIHNVLKGVRSLSLALNDLILKRLNLSIFDLFTPAELNDYLTTCPGLSQPSFHLPFLAAPVGPGMPWPNQVAWQDHYPVPCTLASPGRKLVLVRLVEDRAMELSVGLNNIAVLDISRREMSPDVIYAVDRGLDVVLRRIRLGAGKVYLATDSDLDHPTRWEAVPAPFAPGLLRGQVRWLGQERGTT